MPNQQDRGLDRNEQWMRCMRRGDWEGAWQINDELLCRSDGSALDVTQPRHLQAIWDGRSLRNRRVLVRCYHGLGDTVQFIRFIKPLRKIARQVAVWMQPKLLPLLERTEGIDLALPLHDGAPDIDYDVDIEIMELPYALRTTLDTLPAAVPYIYVSDDQAPPREGAFAAGLVWQAGGWDPNRSVEPGLMRRLTQRSGVSWQVLQRGPALRHWPRGCGTIPPISDIVQEAARLRSLDLLITVDTLSAHLAGALGVPTWLLLPAQADWRWMEHRCDTPWYPSMRLFRQAHVGDWETVINTVATAVDRVSQRRAEDVTR
jgi:hypothetical protein